MDKSCIPAKNVISITVVDKPGVIGIPENF
jgi:hypothetical protein